MRVVTTTLSQFFVGNYRENVRTVKDDVQQHQEVGRYRIWDTMIAVTYPAAAAQEAVISSTGDNGSFFDRVLVTRVWL